MSVPEETIELLESNKSQLQTLVHDLDELARVFQQRFQQTSKIKGVANVAKWQWNKRKITLLCSQANKARTDLHLVMTMVSLFGQRFVPYMGSLYTLKPLSGALTSFFP